MELNTSTIRYLFTAIGCPVGGSGPYTCTQREKTEIHAREINTDNKTESKTYKTITIESIITT